jgi:uncharacterized membrane protein YbhN (UPF0104 family)
MKHQRSSLWLHHSWTPFALLLLAALAAYVLVPQFSQFHATYSVLRQAQHSLLSLAMVISALTYVVAAFTYMQLALHPLLFWRTVLVQVASSFANRILPAGSGGIAVNIDYLRANKHTISQSVVVVAANNALGFIGNVLLLAVFFVFRPQRLAAIHAPALPNFIRIFLIIGTVLLLVATLYVMLHRLRSFMQHLRRDVTAYRGRTSKIMLALLSSCALTVLYSLVMLICARSLQIHLDPGQALFAMTLATAGTVLLPTPGGVASAEAGIVAALIALHVPSAQSLAIAVLYRVFTFWLPLAAGLLALRNSRRYLRY